MSALQILEAIKMQRDLDYHVKASGGITGYPRYTAKFEDPKFVNVLRMSVKSNVMGDEQSTK